jgi:hypothetical protein
MGRLYIVAGGGIAPWKTATICLCIFLGPCALVALWFGLSVLLGIRKTLHQAVADALGDTLGGTDSDAFKAAWRTIRDDHSAMVAALFGDDDNAFLAFRTCIKEKIFEVNSERYKTLRDAWDQEYSRNGWHLAEMYFETLVKMAEKEFHKRQTTRGTSGRRGPRSPPNATSNRAENIGATWQECKRDHKARIRLISANLPVYMRFSL